jgi:hypothetical protein
MMSEKAKVTPMLQESVSFLTFLFTQLNKRPEQSLELVSKTPVTVIPESFYRESGAEMPA